MLLTALISTPLTAVAQDTPEIPAPPPDQSQPEPTPAESAAAEPDARASAADASTSMATPTASGDVNRGNRNHRIAPTPSGETGLIRVMSADGAEERTIRLGFGLDFFSTSDFIRQGDDASRVGGTIGISGSPIDHLELWLNLRAQSANSSLTSPRLLQTQGDMTLGAKGFFDVTQWISVGADLSLGFLSGVGDNLFDPSGTQFGMSALATADLSKTETKAPVRIHLNFGFLIDGSESLLEVEDPENPERIVQIEHTNAERFALGISDFHRLRGGIAVEVPVKYVTPYLEYSLEIPLSYLATPGVVISARERNQGLTLAQAVDEDRGTLARPAVQRVLPQRLTPARSVGFVAVFSDGVTAKRWMSWEEYRAGPSGLAGAIVAELADEVERKILDRSMPPPGRVIARNGDGMWPVSTFPLWKKSVSCWSSYQRAEASKAIARSPTSAPSGTPPRPRNRCVAKTRSGPSGTT